MPAKVRKKRTPWTADEDRIIRREASGLSSPSWVLIAKQLPGRDGDTVRHRWQRHLCPKDAASDGAQVKEAEKEAARLEAEKEAGTVRRLNPHSGYLFESHSSRDAEPERTATMPQAWPYLHALSTPPHTRVYSSIHTANRLPYLVPHRKRSYATRLLSQTGFTK